MAYQIRISNFEGPFDLLFHLINKNKIDIYDIPIADITNQYMNYILEMNKLDLEIASEFIVMAATLLQIKSKMLLPKQKNSDDEIALDMEDPRAELVDKLLEYKKYKDISTLFKEMEEESLNIFYKAPEIIEDIEKDKILLNITMNDIINAFSNVIENYNKNNFIKHYEHEIKEDVYTVDDKMNYIRNTVVVNNKINFKNLFLNIHIKQEIIITFLALLELIRLKEIIIYQENNFNDILIEKIA